MAVDSVLLPFAEDFATVIVFAGDVLEPCLDESAGFLDVVCNDSYEAVVMLFEKFFAALTLNVTSELINDVAF